SFKDIWTENNIIDRLGLKDIVGKPDTSNINGKEAFLNLSIMNDPEQVLTEYPYRISDIASKIGDDHWYRANKIINEIEKKYNIEIKTSNNIYHLDVGVNGSNHRYSNKLLDLITKYINGEEIEGKIQQI
ncbi:hypothetical protein G6Z19_13030, partial [Clostridium perfringens]|nr:hypothetical protein [Clostridium perfringens]